MSSILNDTKVKSFKSKDQNYTESDGNGLQLLIKTTSKKLWEFRYTSTTLNKRRKTSFGNYPETTLKTARTKRDYYLELISNGVDLLEQKLKDKEEKNKELNGIFKDVMYQWLEKESEHTKEITHKGKLCFTFHSKNLNVKL